MNKPDCYKCQHRQPIPGSSHSQCHNWKAQVTANPYGRGRGWFIWPLDFDPVWLETCTGCTPIQPVAPRVPCEAHE